ncbi:MAG TPA: hypothetical protein ENN51_01440, partial [candidate division WOR-3 bacterium]|nr:hypothetical protein [candidate division WOR-3 bacterium]
SYTLSGNAIHASPAIDPGQNRLYVADEEGNLVALNLVSFTDDWLVNVGAKPSSPVIGEDGAVYVGAGGRLLALDPADGNPRWTFRPPLSGTVSTPAVSDQGIVYVIVSAGRKKAARAAVRRAASDDVDSLYAVNGDGSRRWAFGLDYGDADDIISAPKIDAAGNVYLGNGYLAWVVRGVGGPADSPWPMFQRDGQNTGRSRN